VYTPSDNTAAPLIQTVSQARPIITWTNPADIVYGTPLSGTQLDAAASWTVGGVTVRVAGSFIYTPAAGTVLGAGNHETLSVAFTPTDLTDYTAASASTTINVSQRGTTTTLTASTPEGAPGESVTFTATVVGGLPAPYLPTGRVQFQVNGVNTGSPVPLSSAGTAILSTTEPTSGPFTVTAVYSGDPDFRGSASPAYTESVFSPGVFALGTTLYVVGANTSDAVLISPWGNKLDGSAGLAVVATLNHSLIAKAFTQSFTAIDVFGYGGNDTIGLIPTITLPTTVVEGDGNDVVVLGSGPSTVIAGNGNDSVLAIGNGNDVVTLGNGNDSVNLGGGNDTISLGNGNDFISAGDGNDNVTVGNGNDNVQLGNGSDVIVEGNGNDQVSAGNGADVVVAGLGQHTISLGNGNDILIDGSATVVNSGDSLRQILSDWNTSSSASVDTRLKIVYNTSHPNVLKAGKGRDWWFYTYNKNSTNIKKTDRLN
jgi:Ca2+-binding RTX toxin-like protein